MIRAVLAVMLLAGCAPGSVQLYGHCRGVYLREIVAPGTLAAAGECEGDYYFDTPFGHKFAGEK